ncbi:MAG: hypothetical protein Q9226_003472 [Calogaya cf. arnoldii]
MSGGDAHSSTKFARGARTENGTIEANRFILREDFLTTERQWIDSQNRSAPPPLIYPEDDDMKDPISDNEHQAEGMIDQVISQENEEVHALVSLFEENLEDARHEKVKRPYYGSDDEKYDSIFLDLLSSTSDRRLSTTHARPGWPQGDDEALPTESMDTSGG